MLQLEDCSINDLDLECARQRLERCRLQTSRFFTVDLTKIKGKGDFSCPRCGTRISPADRTEKAYKILEAQMRGDELDSIMLRCNKCESHIHLTGFRTLRMTT
jgi:DNA-directed RNA polymerase subunit RPC12/RpoP